jgi:hypothetical protein
VTPAAAPACPHCCRTGEDTAPQRGGKPCECGGCEVTVAVISDTAVVVSGPQRNLLDLPAEAVVGIRSVLAHLPETVRSTGPPDFFCGSLRDLPILLGQLLL